METEYLREYIEFSQTLNYAKAADELFISQPALRSHIRTLEEEVGAEIIVRREGRVELSLTGRLLLKHARDIVEATSSALEACRALSKNSTMLLVGTLGYPPFEGLITTARENTRALYPEVEIDLRFLSTVHANLAAITDRKADISILPRIRGIAERARPQDPGFPSEIEAHYLQTEECQLWITKDNPLFSKPAIDANDLEGQSLLLGNTDNMVAAGLKLKQYFKHEGVRIEINNQPFACYGDYFFTPHDGFGIVIEALHPAFQDRKDLRIFAVKEFSIPCDMFIIYDGSHFDRPGKLYLEQLAALAQK